MSTETPPPSAENRPTTHAEKPARNPVEKILVWGLILIGVGICATEALARFGYTKSLNSLQTALEADNSGDVLRVDEVSDHISGFPKTSHDEAGNVLVYHWSGLLKEYGSIRMHYSDEQEILGLLTADAPPEEEHPVATDDSSGDDEEEEGEEGYDPPEAGMGGGGRGSDSGQGGQGGGFDPIQNDADGDGKLSLEEAPDRMKERFDTFDTNSDGFIDTGEIEVLRRARGAGQGGGRGNRPQRPSEDSPAAEDSESAVEEPADIPPAEVPPAETESTDSDAPDGDAPDGEAPTTESSETESTKSDAPSDPDDNRE